MNVTTLHSIHASNPYAQGIIFPSVSNPQTLFLQLITLVINTSTTTSLIAPFHPTFLNPTSQVGDTNTNIINNLVQNEEIENIKRLV